MKFKILTSILIIFSLFSGCSIPDVRNDVQLNKDAGYTAGHGNICYNQYIDIGCSKDLVCTSITTEPYEIKVCLKPNETVDPDFISKTYENMK